MKMSMALALMLAVLAFENMATACPLGVCMGDTFKPYKGWSPGGYGERGREYQGVLGLGYMVGYMVVRGTRADGACMVEASTYRDSRENYVNLKEGLLRKYGKPSSEVQDETWWIPSTRSSPMHRDKISSMVLSIDDTLHKGTLGPSVHLKYSFQNIRQCEKARKPQRRPNKAADPICRTLFASDGKMFVNCK